MTCIICEAVADAESERWTVESAYMFGFYAGTAASEMGVVEEAGAAMCERHKEMAESVLGDLEKALGEDGEES